MKPPLDFVPHTSPPAFAPTQVEVSFPEQPFGGVVVQNPEQTPVVIEINRGSPVISVFGREGAVTAQGSDYASFYAPLSPSVQSVFGREGAVTALASDYSAFYQPLGFYAPLSAGMPRGGDVSAVLQKNSALDYDASWQILTTTTQAAWVYKTQTTMADPGNGNMRADNAAFNSAANLAVSVTTNNNYNRSALLSSLQVGDQFLIQDNTNPSNAIRYSVRVLPVNNTTWFQIGVSLVTSTGSSPSNNDELIFSFTTSGAGGSGAVSSVFGRTGAVVALAGDYTAAKVTNAVDQTQTYVNPAWITSLPWSKITATPISLTGYGIVASATDYAAFYPQMSSAYSNPAWITSLAWAKITGAPALAPGGSDTQVQFNNAGAFGGDANFTYNKSSANPRIILGNGSGGYNGIMFGSSLNQGIFQHGTSNAIDFNVGGVVGTYLSPAGFSIISSNIYGWSSSSTDPSLPLDTGFYRNAAGVVEINNGTPGTFADLKLRNLILNPQASAPTGSEGMIYASSSNHHPWYYNGTTFVDMLAGGGGGTPGGSDTQIQYNNAGAFGAIPTATYNTSTGALSLSSGGTNQNLSLGPSGTGTTNITSNPGASGRNSVTFTNTQGINKSSQFTFYSNATPLWSFGNDGTTNGIQDLYIYDNVNSTSRLYFGAGTANGGPVVVPIGTVLGWANAATVAAQLPADTGLYRNAAGVVEINNGTAGQYRDLVVRNLIINAQASPPIGSAGTILYDGKVHYSTHAVNERGVISSVQWIASTATVTLANTTSLQAMFAGVGTATNGQVTVSANFTYRFKTMFYITGLSSTTNVSSYAIGGTATISSIQYTGTAVRPNNVNVSNSAGSAVWGTQASAVAITTTSANPNLYGDFEGIIRIGNTGGTIIPQFSSSVAGTTPVLQPNSFFELWPVGSDTTQVSGNWN